MVTRAQINKDVIAIYQDIMTGLGGDPQKVKASAKMWADLRLTIAQRSTAADPLSQLTSEHEGDEITYDEAGEFTLVSDAQDKAWLRIPEGSKE